MNHVPYSFQLQENKKYKDGIYMAKRMSRSTGHTRPV